MMKMRNKDLWCGCSSMICNKSSVGEVGNLENGRVRVGQFCGSGKANKANEWQCCSLRCHLLGRRAGAFIYCIIH